MHCRLPEGLQELNPWAGLHPATPTALALIGQHAKAPKNMLFNVGHGALGFTLAFGSAARIAGMLKHTSEQSTPRQKAGFY